MGFVAVSNVLSEQLSLQRIVLVGKGTLRAPRSSTSDLLLRYVEPHYGAFDSQQLEICSFFKP
jgi:hypothetical protein